MYALVEDVTRYPEFLPWCAGAKLHFIEKGVLEASIEVQRSGLRKSFRTRNALWPGERMDIALVGGPFRVLAGGWRFEQLGEDGCRVSLELEFEFENALTDKVFGPFIEDICNSMVDSFTRRADEIYGG